MGQAITTFFTATVVDAAKNAWGTVVQGVTVFGKWLAQEVKSLVTTVIKGITDMLKGLKEFFINCWHSVEAFTKKIFGLNQNLKDYVWNGVFKVGKGLVNAGVEHMKERLKQLGYKEVDSLTDDQVEKLWNEHMSTLVLTPEEKQAAKDTFPPNTFPDESGPSKMMSGTGAYSKLESPAATGLDIAAIPQDSEQFKHVKDYAITHLTFVLFSPDQLKIGLPKSVTLSLQEEEELNRILVSV